MRGLTKFFLWSFLLEGGLSLAAGGFDALEPFWIPRQMAGFAVILSAFILLLAMLFTPRVAKRLVLLPALFVVWRLCGALPLSLFLEERALAVALGVAQIVLALTVVLICGERGAWHWPILEIARQRPAFSWKNFLATGCGAGLFALFIVALWLQGASFLVESKTDGYVRLRPAGISLEERRFARGDKEVRLIGMVHLARGDFYEQTARSLPRNASAIVLVEGVTDHSKLLKKKFGYAQLAQNFGLTSQTESGFQASVIQGIKEQAAQETTSEAGQLSGASPAPLEFRSGDIDVSAFQPKTLRILEAVGALFASTTLQEAVTKIEDPNSPFNDKEAAEVLFDDVLDKRNEHLLIEIEKALTTHQVVVVPWGAMHLAAIQKRLEAGGFVETSRSGRLALSFQRRQ